MLFVGEDDIGMDTLCPTTCEKRILLYDHRLEDYFLEYSQAWNTIKTPIYTVLLGDEIFAIPSSLFVVCGDAGGESDLIIFEETIGREIGIICIKNGFRKAEWHVPRVLSVDMEGSTLYPMVNKFVPLTDSEEKSVILTIGSDRIGGKKIEYEEFIV